MRVVAFWGCKIPYYLEHYRTATRSVARALGLEFVEPEFGCCGYPVRHLDFDTYMVTAARNLALAEKHGNKLVTPCKCCFGSLKYADHVLREMPQVLDQVNHILTRENLKWTGRVEVRHLLSVLSEDVGLDAVRAAVTKPYEGLQVAASYGCHALRPSKITGFDDPLAPTIFENLIKATGAECVEWERRVDCCGNPLMEKNQDLSLALMDKKIMDAGKAGAQFICTACTYCQIQFDQMQDSFGDRPDAPGKVPAILYPQLLGLSLGMDETSLGLDKNRLDASGLKEFLTIPVPAGTPSEEQVEATTTES